MSANTTEPTSPRKRRSDKEESKSRKKVRLLHDEKDATKQKRGKRETVLQKDVVGVVDRALKLAKRKERDIRRKEKKRSHKAPHRLSWSISNPIGGRFTPLDPVFSLDEK